MRRQPNPKGNLPARAVKGIEDQILVIRGQRVMLDRDLARLYGVTTKRINEQVKRNRKRFPEGFMFQLTFDEARSVLSSRSQIATLKKGQNIKHAPHAFSEHGAIMLASVLNSATAIQASVFVVVAFVRMRSIIADYSKLAARVDQLEQDYDEKFHDVFKAIRQLMAPPAGPRRAIGFIASATVQRKNKK
jgi:ORF6N domain-containing protein